MISTLKNHLVNIPGWRTNRKIVVFESDDWGMIRMASKDSYRRLKSHKIPLEKSAYNQFDSLETNADLLQLMEVLNSVKDINNKPAIITINNIVANPDFNKINQSKFEEYYYRPFTENLKDQKESDQVMDLYRQGIHGFLFQPQFHGREHVHVGNWFTNLRAKTHGFVEAFNEGMFTVNGENGMSCREECLDAMGIYSTKDETFVAQSIREGAKLFKDIWGFPSRSVIAPCYTWHTTTEKEFKKAGIKYIQGARAQRQQNPDADTKVIKRHYMGKKSQDGLIYLIRNVNFEPVENPNKDWVGNAMKEIETAFLWKKPAIISTHRVNFMGTLDPNNRKRNLQLLSRLLKTIVKKYPNVEFMSSDQVGGLIKGE
jgi:hypothetical protein